MAEVRAAAYTNGCDLEAGSSEPEEPEEEEFEYEEEPEE